MLAAAFAPDSNTLCTSGMDTAILVWDVYGDGSPFGRATLTEANLRPLWTILAQNDGVESYRAMSELVRSGGQAVLYLTKRLRLRQVPLSRLDQLVSELGDQRFKVRENATTELASLGELAEPTLKELLRGRPPTEVRRRADL